MDFWIFFSPQKLEFMKNQKTAPISYPPLGTSCLAGLPCLALLSFRILITSVLLYVVWVVITHHEWLKRNIKDELKTASPANRAK